MILPSTAEVRPRILASSKSKTRLKSLSSEMPKMCLTRAYASLTSIPYLARKYDFALLTGLVSSDVPVIRSRHLLAARTTSFQKFRSVSMSSEDRDSAKNCHIHKYG